MKLSAFLGHNIARGSGGDNVMNPKPNKKLSLGAESYGTIAWKGFFTQSQVLFSSIVDNVKLKRLCLDRTTPLREGGGSFNTVDEL